MTAADEDDPRSPGAAEGGNTTGDNGWMAYRHPRGPDTVRRLYNGGGE